MTRGKSVAKVTGIVCPIITGDVDGAGTDGDIYLGIGGREFRLDSREDDYERGSWREYVLGTAPLESNLAPPQIRVRNWDRNDPTLRFLLDTNDLPRTPVYIRFEPQGAYDNWNLFFAAALVYAGTFCVGYAPPETFNDLWLGQASGKVLHLTSEWSDEQKLLEKVRRTAARNSSNPPPRT
jgi:hypothetical protein